MKQLEFDGKTWVFTPIGILSFKCYRDTARLVFS